MKTKIAAVALLIGAVGCFLSGDVDMGYGLVVAALGAFGVGVGAKKIEEKKVTPAEPPK